VAADATVELVAYRVVQESLANVLQHAPGAQAAVSVRRAGDDLVEVAVANTAPPSRVVPGRGRRGLGERGMAERARAVGGELETGPTADGGWRVVATLPLRGAAPARPGDDGARAAGLTPR
jgi:signal transduction histidine kinase